MPRKRRHADGETQAVTGDTSGEGEGRMQVTLTGAPSKIKRQLGIEGDGKGKKGLSEVGASREAFVTALRDPRNVVTAQRIDPLEWEGRRADLQVYRQKCPIDYGLMERQIAEKSGGRIYRVEVVNEDQESVAARTIEVSGDPVLPPIPEPDEDFYGPGSEERTPAAISRQVLTEQIEQTSAQIQLESLKQQLADVRSGSPTATGNGGAKATAHLERQIYDLERRLEREAIEKRHQDEVGALRGQMADLARKVSEPKRDSEANEISVILQQMQKMQESSDTRFNALMKQMQDDKMNAILDEVKAVRHRSGEKTGMLEMAETMLKLKKVFGWDDDEKGGGDDDDPDKPWWERLADKYIPKLLDRFDEDRAAGKSVSKDELVKEIEKLATQAENEAVERAKARLQKAGPPNPPPALPAPAAPSPVVAAAAPPPLPPPPPGAAGAPTGQPPSDTAPAPAVPSVDDERRFRVSRVLTVLARELEIRPREFCWNYDGVWLTLPDDVVERIATAKDVPGAVDAFGVDGINRAGLEELKAKISGSPRIAAWFSIGLDELRSWWAKSLSDPKFDPSDEWGEDGDGDEEGAAEEKGGA